MPFDGCRRRDLPPRLDGQSIPDLYLLLCTLSYVCERGSPNTMTKRIAEITIENKTKKLVEFTQTANVYELLSCIIISWFCNEQIFNEIV